MVCCFKFQVKSALIILMLMCSSIVAYGHDATIIVLNQQGFDRIDEAICDAAKAGKKDILVKVRCGSYLFHENHLTLKGLPSDVSVAVKGKKVKVYAGGRKVGLNDVINLNNVYYQGKKYAIVDNWTEVKQCDRLIEVVDSTTKLCRLELMNGDVATKGDVIQTSQWYMTCKYTISDYRDGYVYFTADNLKYVSWGKQWNVNYDYAYCKEMPRYRIWRTKNAKNGIYQGEAMRFMSLRNVNPKSLTIEGITFCGNSSISSGALIQLSGVKSESIRFRKCVFENCHSTCIILGSSTNISVENCRFSENYTTCIYSGGGCENVNITDCLFENNSKGWSNTFCINIKGKDFLVARNTFRDFAYGAIGIGEHYGDKKTYVSGVVADNEIYYTNTYYADYKKHTLMDSGAIYLWTQNDNVVIRNNYIHDYIGIKDNRGIFCDDGASNFAIIGNTILRIANSYCVDSRLIKDQRPGAFTNNVNITITDNTFDGDIRFEGRDENGNRCVYGRNTIKTTPGAKASERRIVRIKVIKEDKILQQ